MLRAVPAWSPVMILTAMPVARFDRGNGFVPRRVHQPQHAEQDEPARFHVGRGNRIGFMRPGRDGQQPVPLLGHLLHALLPDADVEGRGAVRRALPITERRDSLGRPLHSNRPFVLGGAVEGSHVAVFGFEGYEVEPGMLFVRVRSGTSCLLRHRYDATLGRVTIDLPFAVFVPVEGRVAGPQSGPRTVPEGAVPLHRHCRPVAAKRSFWRVSAARHLVGPPTADEAADRHLVAGEGARFVRADDRNGPERLHGGKLADNGVLPGHPLNAQGERDRNDRRQPLRNGRHGQSHHDQKQLLHAVEGLENVSVPKGEGTYPEDRKREPHAKLVDLPQERRRELLNRRKHLSDVPNLRVLARSHHHAAPLSPGHDRARVGHARPVAHRRIFVYRLGLLRHRHRLAGHRRLFDLQILGRKEAQVGRDTVPGLN